MPIYILDSIHHLLCPTGRYERWYKRLIRRILCGIEDHPTASWDDSDSDFLTCDWCGASWKEKRPTPSE